MADQESNTKAEEPASRQTQPEKEKQADRETHAKQPRPADFLAFLSSIAGKALINMGQVANPITKKREVDLQEAKYAIDLLQILKEKTKGNLTEDEQKNLDGLLYDLRTRFVAACR